MLARQSASCYPSSADVQIDANDCTANVQLSIGKSMLTCLIAIIHATIPASRSMLAGYSLALLETNVQQHGSQAADIAMNWLPSCSASQTLPGQPPWTLRQ